VANATVSPNGAARSISVALKRPVTPKGVRTMARSIIARFNKDKHPEYQAHQYNAAEVRTLTDAFKARGSRSVAQPARKARTAKVARKVTPKVTAPE
jgi:hypothetical protein